MPLEVVTHLDVGLALVPLRLRHFTLNILHSKALNYNWTKKLFFFYILMNQTSFGCGARPELALVYVLSADWYFGFFVTTPPCVHTINISRVAVSIVERDCHHLMMHTERAQSWKVSLVVRVLIEAFFIGLSLAVGVDEEAEVLHLNADQFTLSQVYFRSLILSFVLDFSSSSCESRGLRRWTAPRFLILATFSEHRWASLIYSEGDFRLWLDSHRLSHSMLFSGEVHHTSRVKGKTCFCVSRASCCFSIQKPILLASTLKAINAKHRKRTQLNWLLITKLMSCNLWLSEWQNWVKRSICSLHINLVDYSAWVWPCARSML